MSRQEERNKFIQQLQNGSYIAGTIFKITFGVWTLIERWIFRSEKHLRRGNQTIDRNERRTEKEIYSLVDLVYEWRRSVKRRFTA